MTDSRKRGLVIAMAFLYSFGAGDSTYTFPLLKVHLLISTVQPLRQEKVVGTFITQFFQPVQALGKEEKEKKIQDLYDELQHERERSATFRQQLCWILKDLEDHSQFMTLRVEDIVNSMKDIELGDL
ncbi:protein FAR1-RELATED SEQUENCE 5-like [Fagus crenata]